MHMLYNSDSFTVVQIDLPPEASASPDADSRGGYEIVDKFARKEIFIHGVLAESFKSGVEALIQSEPSEDEIDEFIEGYTSLLQQPLVVH